MSNNLPIQRTRLDFSSITNDGNFEPSNNPAEDPSEPIGATTSGVSVRVVTPERRVPPSGYITPPITIRPANRSCTPIQQKRRELAAEERENGKKRKKKTQDQGEINIQGPEPEFDGDGRKNFRPPSPPPPSIEVF